MSVLASPDPRPPCEATILTLIAGIADAVGYITMGGVFAANMTGNTVLAGIAAAQRDYTDAWHHLAPLLAFFLGAMLSRLLLRLSHRPTAGLLVEAALLAVVGFLPISPRVCGVDRGGGDGRAGLGHHPLRRQRGQHRRGDQHPGAHRRRRARPAVAGREEPLPVVANLPLLALTWVGYLAGAVSRRAAARRQCPIRCWCRSPCWGCCCCSDEPAYIGGVRPSLP